ncbi:MAG: hypothetical protein M5U09_18630 [Gammaproteobacteria bacterium]|nr:hypothetical protein [Gammaproteobacteria bacterium]
MPLAVPLVQQGLAFPEQLAARLDAALPRLGLVLTIAAVLGLTVSPLLQYLHAVSLRRRSWRKAGFQVYRLAVPLLGAVVAIGLLWPPLLTTAVVLGPLFLGLAAITPAAARPIGRVRQAAGWSAGLAWWLAAVLSYLALAWPALLCLPVAGLAAVALLAQGHPDRYEPPRPALWPLVGLAPLLVIAVGGLSRADVSSSAMTAELADRGVRVATIDLAPDGRLDPAQLARQGRELRGLGARLVLVRESAGGEPVFWDGPAWLARRLDLQCYRLPGHEPRLALLAPAPPETLISPNRTCSPRPGRSKARALVSPSVIGLASREQRPSRRRPWPAVTAP